MKKRFSLFLCIISIIIFIIILLHITLKSKYLKGNIIFIKDNYIEIMTENSSIYKLKYSNTIYKIGDYIKIKYNGNLNDLDETQNISIKNIKIDNSKKESNIEQTINKMLLEEKIGQLLLARIPVENKLDDLIKYNFCGYILFQRDIKNKSKKDIIDEIDTYQQNSKIHLIIAIDEEGGTVSRLNCNGDITVEKFLSPQELYNKGGFTLIEKDAIRKRELLKELGINMNLAPVADVTTNSNAYMYNRSFGHDADLTSQYIKTIMGTQSDNVTYVLKHFPGYGNNIDTHSDIAIDYKTLDNFRSNDFKPFITGINNNAKAIMVSHNIVLNIDNKPATLSRNIHNLLRNELNFNGLIITDDLSMNAIKKYNSQMPYIDAIKAGNNILIVSDYQNAYTEIYNGVKNELISEELINLLIKRTLEFKYKNM